MRIYNPIYPSIKDRLEELFREVSIESVEITKTAPSSNEIAIGGDVVISISITPPNYTEKVYVIGVINDIADVEYGKIKKTESNGS